MLQQFNATASENHAYDLSLYPEPFFGAVTAPVVLLALNPGVSPHDAVAHSDPVFAQQALSNLSHTLTPFPFLHLQRNSIAPGAKWCAQRTRELVSDVGFDAVANGLACVQYMPYHSRLYSQRTPLLPSQRYSFALVRHAIARGAEIVVPELARYERVHVTSNPRAAYLTEGNLKSSYQRIVERLCEPQSSVAAQS